MTKRKRNYSKWVNFSIGLGLIFVLGFKVIDIYAVSGRTAQWLQGEPPTETEFTAKLTENNFTLKDAAHIEALKDYGCIISLFSVIFLLGGIQHGIENHDPRFMYQCLICLCTLIAAMVASPQLLLAVLTA